MSQVLIQQIQEEITNAFSDLEFEEGRHIYKVGNKLLPSVSGLVKKHAPGFDEKLQASRIAKKRNCTTKEVLDEWAEIRDTAATKGTRVHLYAENKILGKDTKPSCPQEIAANSFLEYLFSTGRYLLVWTELQMYSKLYNYAGTCDLLLYDLEEEGLVLVDYKTNKSLDKQYEYLLAPFSYSANTPYNKYQIQLSYYQIMLEEALSIPVLSRMIVWLKMDSTFETRLTTDFTTQLKEYLEC